MAKVIAYVAVENLTGPQVKERLEEYESRLLKFLSGPITHSFIIVPTNRKNGDGPELQLEYFPID